MSGIYRAWGKDRGEEGHRSILSCQLRSKTREAPVLTVVVVPVVTVGLGCAGSVGLAPVVLLGPVPFCKSARQRDIGRRVDSLVGHFLPLGQVPRSHDQSKSQHSLLRSCHLDVSSDLEAKQ